MTKARTRFVCQQCGTSYPKWAGRCDNCGAWNSLLETAPVETGKSVVARSKGQKLTTEKISQVKLDTVADRDRKSVV
jgi:DNA repair protein RadA/Sms